MTATENYTAVRECPACGTADRYQSGACKACTRAWQVKYRAANKDKIKEYLVANKARINTVLTAYRIDNKEKIAARNLANQDRIRATDAARRERNKEARNAHSVAWRQANPKDCRVYSQNRRAIKKASGGVLSKGIADRLFVLQKGLCPCCHQPLGDDYHIDHIIPLARGGQNIDSNVQLLRNVCNQRKNAKHPIQYMQERGFLL